MELLILLAQRRGQLVTRAEIVERLWGKDVFVDADAAINTAVRKVRRALDDDPDEPQFVETVVGKGYRFAGPIRLSPGPEPSPVLDRAEEPGRRKWANVPVALALLLVVILSVLAVARSRRDEAIQSVAVLPFENVGADANAEYLSDGLTESLINRLSRLRQLRVIARASVFRYMGKHLDLASVARELRVRGVVSGRVSQRPDGSTFGAGISRTSARSRRS